MAQKDVRTLAAEMPKTARDFANYKLAIENCSKKTVSEYLLDLRTFFRFLLAIRSGMPTNDLTDLDVSGLDLQFVRDITTTEIYEFLMYAGDERGNEWSAKARKLSAIKAFFKFLCVKQHLIEENPAANIDSPKRRSTLPKFLSLDESVALLDAISEDGENRHRKRDFAILTLFLNCGMRLSELCGIDITDIDNEMRSVKVTGKGAKERIIYLNDACRSALTDYLQTRLGEDFSKSGPALFTSQRGTRISPKTVQWLVCKHLKAAGLEYKGYSTHKLRHTAATLMYQSGQVDVRVLKDILGHEQLNTTQIYTHVSDMSMQSAVNANPLASHKISKPKKKNADNES
ncbi:MAG: tyrosine recombinase XerC [Clostridia bacterium]|nr:tyrosine recombinase XerC [Clostridia bacterium]MBQ1934678.1 tyrosine recombinase XerC [Clostridia bacterium]MBQ5649566.1 tyrosine recombinase XerC [Clostridia bacterium]MBQ5809094.1 tyrosine recombinase XerC [Clostridia bacterium]